MLFSLFATRSKPIPLQLTDEEKVLFALQRYREAIEYLEQSLVEELCNYAKKTNNYTPDVGKFMELYDLYSLYPYLCESEAILDSYRKRDILLDQIALLIGDDPTQYKGSDTHQNNLPLQTIGEYREKSLHLGLTPTSIKDEPLRSTNTTHALKSKSDRILSHNTKTTDKSSLPAALRITKAKYHLDNNELTLKKLRDTSEVDSFIWGIIRQIKRLFSSTSHVAGMVEEVTPMLNSSKPESAYVSLTTLLKRS